MDILTAVISSNRLQPYIENLLGTHQLLSCFEDAHHFCVTLSVSESRPLHIAKLGDRVTVTQNAKTGVGTFPDPEMIFQIDRHGEWIPVEARLSTGAWIKCASDSWLSNIRERAYMHILASRWVKQLEINKYERGEVTQLCGEND